MLGQLFLEETNMLGQEDIHLLMKTVHRCKQSPMSTIISKQKVLNIPFSILDSGYHIVVRTSTVNKQIS
jgi:hypothetical protein